MNWKVAKHLCHESIHLYQAQRPGTIPDVALAQRFVETTVGTRRWRDW
jgi:hypothetical protein